MSSQPKQGNLLGNGINPDDFSNTDENTNITRLVYKILEIGDNNNTFPNDDTVDANNKTILSSNDFFQSTGGYWKYCADLDGDANFSVKDLSKLIQGSANNNWSLHNNASLLAKTFNPVYTNTNNLITVDYGRNILNNDAGKTAAVAGETISNHGFQIKDADSTVITDGIVSAKIHADNIQKIVLTLENSYGHISALDDGSVYTIYQNANTGFVFEPISPYIGINTIKSDFEFTFNDKAPSISNFNVLSGDLNNGNISKSNPTFEFDINKSMHVEITANPALTSTVSKTYDTPGTKNIQISGLTNGQYTFTIKATDNDSSDISTNTYQVTLPADTTPPVITSLATGTNLEQGVGQNQKVYEIEASGDAVSYNIAGTDSEYLTVDTSTGVVTLDANPVYATKPNYSFTVTATDSAGNTSTPAHEVTFSINDPANWPASETPTFKIWKDLKADGTGKTSVNSGHLVTPGKDGQNVYDSDSVFYIEILNHVSSATYEIQVSETNALNVVTKNTVAQTHNTSLAKMRKVNVVDDDYIGTYKIKITETTGKTPALSSGFLIQEKRPAVQNIEILSGTSNPGKRLKLTFNRPIKWSRNDQKYLKDFKFGIDNLAMLSNTQDDGALGGDNQDTTTGGYYELTIPTHEDHVYGKDVASLFIQGTTSTSQNAYGTLGLRYFTAAEFTVSSLKLTNNSELSKPTISYSGSPFTFTNGVASSAPAQPNISGGTVTTWSISPTIGYGLYFNTSNGYISGTPNQTVTGASYTVTGSNGFGSEDSATITITVNAAAVASPAFTFSNDVFTFQKGTDIAATTTAGFQYSLADRTPSSTGGAVASWSIDPDLPNGLSLDGDGVISGTPTVTQGETSYTVTATNATSSATDTIKITISDAAVASPAFTLGTSNTNVFKYDGATGILSLEKKDNISGWVADETFVFTIQQTTSTIEDKFQSVAELLGNISDSSGNQTATYILEDLGGTTDGFVEGTSIIFNKGGGMGGKPRITFGTPNFSTNMNFIPKAAVTTSIDIIKIKNSSDADARWIPKKADLENIESVLKINLGQNINITKTSSDFSIEFVNIPE